MSNKRIAFIVHNYPLGISPMIINSIRMFLRKGFYVDVYINRKNLDDLPINFENKKASFIVYNDADNNRSFFLKVFYFFLDKLKKFSYHFPILSKVLPISLCIWFFYPEWFIFSKWLKKKLSRYDYTYFIPIECQSLLSLFFLKKKGEIIYYNMELLDWKRKDSSHIINNFLKNLEYRMIKKISKVVIQSPQRAKLFSKINNFDSKKIYILPIASMGKPIKKKGKFFRRLFNIPKNTKIVIYAGAFKPWAKCLEIIRSMKEWPRDFVLIMHTGNKGLIGTPYYQQMKRGAKGLPVYFSKSYIKYDKLAKALSSADISLLFYKPIDSNFKEILFSSNKLTEYLKAGLPIICSDFPSLKKFVKENEIGSAISSFDELPQKLALFRNKISLLRKNALVCYQKKFRFEKYFEDFYKKLPKRDLID